MVTDEQYQRLLRHCEALQKENAELKSLLHSHKIAYVFEGDKAEVSPYSPIVFPLVQLTLDGKVRLFRSLFRGREDVYARRWQSRTTGKGGYQPVCINEWRSGKCDKKRYKCAECPSRNFAPLSDGAVYKHLEGKSEDCLDVIGLYAVMVDNSCAFLCTDFDDKNCEHGYKDDVRAFTAVCKEWGIPYGIERSRSGKGAHVWIFFENSVPAYKARRLGNAVLTEAMKRNGRMSFKSYVRFFPNQDYLPEGGLGNLVALPLQGQARKKMNSVFVDDNFLVYKDQWAFLSNIGKVDCEGVERLLREHFYEDLGKLSTSTESKPWQPPVVPHVGREDFYTKVVITKADKLYIPLKAVSARVINHLKRIAAFRNPEFYRKQAMHLSTFSVPRVISCFEFSDDYLLMPRGCEDTVTSFLRDANVDFTITEATNPGHPIPVSFQGELYAEQEKAVEALSAHDNGVLYATTAFGKTVVAAALIAHKKVNTLVLVHSKALLRQWNEQLSKFLKIDYEEPEQRKGKWRNKVFSPIGCLDSTRNLIHGIIDIALIQSCMDDAAVKSFVHEYGMVIVDECHHVSSVTFEKVLKNITARYVYGLTATPIRKDGHQSIIFMQCGPIRFSAATVCLLTHQNFSRYLIPRFTSYRSLTDSSESISSLYQSLAEDGARNRLIVDDVCKSVEAGRTPIILTNRKQHVLLLSDMLQKRTNNVITLLGTATTKEKENVLLRLRSISPEESLVIVATGQYVGEGFDYPRLDTLFLALPISWKGLLAQYAGRLHRDYEGKQDVRIYDYIDIHHSVCDSMYRKRLKGYASLGYKAISLSSPTLFDNLPNLKLLAGEGQIFNGNIFLAPLCKDLSAAKRSIVISSPKLYCIQQNKLTHIFKDILINGIDVIVFSRQENAEVDYLRSLGVTVNISKTLSYCSAVIDKSTVWYGSINLLGFVKEEDNIIRLTDTSLGSELIETLISSAL